MRKIWIAGLTLACGMAAPALAQDDTQTQDQIPTKPLTGDYYMAPPMDTTDPKAPVDHIFMTITGDAAKAMWDAMKADITPDECVGRMSRFINGLVCYGPSTQASQPLGSGESPYECYLGINLKTAVLELGQDC